MHGRGKAEDTDEWIKTLERDVCFAPTASRPNGRQHSKSVQHVLNLAGMGHRWCRENVATCPPELCDKCVCNVFFATLIHCFTSICSFLIHIG